ncbi:unnamed protein product [Rotaria sordida]|uniref:Transmembrane protein n=1 Tax=Rotaria sordida TaxID=392033 RepID=A0A814I2S7_9BILA|nr:unnamed protein product [Rotaria sordida]
MPLNLSCLNSYSFTPSIPLLSNVFNNFNHSTYKSNENSLIQKLSSSIINSKFSLHDIELLFNIFSKKNQHSLNIFILLKTKLISSIFIYTIIILILFLLFSIIFYIISYIKFKKFKINYKNIFLIILIILNHVLFIYKIVIINNVHKTKNSLNKSLYEINREIYPKSFIKHLHHLIKQLTQFDEYSIKSNSIVVLGLKSIMIEAFNRLLKENYFIEDLFHYFNNIDNNYYQLRDSIMNETILTILFDQFTISYKNMTNDLINFNKKLCYYFDNYKSDFNKQILKNLNIFHEKIQFFIQFIEKQIINKINANFLDQKQEDKIHRYIALIAYLITFIIVCITIIPLIFISIKIFLQWKNEQNIQRNVDKVDSSLIQNDNRQHYPMNVMSKNTVSNQNQSDEIENNMRSINNKYSNSLSDIDQIENNKFEDHDTSRLFLFSIRIVFIFILILVIFLLLITGFLYGLDLLLHGSCRLVHYNQPFLISFTINNFLNQMNNFDINITILNIINDCNNNIHFSKILFKNASIQLNDQLSSTIKDFNQEIFQQFLNVNNKINITSDLDLLINLANLNSLNNIANYLKYIKNDFEQIDQIFKQILTPNSALLGNFTKEIFHEFEKFVIEVTQSTIDPCPLPIDIILKMDQLICHHTAKIINGVWLEIFLFMFFIVFGLYIFGIYVYKQFD